MRRLICKQGISENSARRGREAICNAAFSGISIWKVKWGKTGRIEDMSIKIKIPLTDPRQIPSTLLTVIHTLYLKLDKCDTF